MDKLEYPGGMSIIARTAGIGRSAPELQWDLNYLLKLWTAIDGAGKGGKGAFLIYQESSLVIRAIRDYFNSDIGDILFDTDDVYEQARQFMAHVMPEHEHRVKRYRDDAPLFSRFQIEHQIESAYARTVQLPSGGAIVIDHTEALVSVDVNSARAIKGGDIEETATRTNLEAADEVARQMRLRDLGGLIVIDFIDMEESRNRRDVENRLRDALRQDRARVQFGTISKFGLMEMSRQRLRPALSEGASIPCPRCGGSGHIRDTESSALQILRIIQEESLKDSTASVLCQVPVDVASFLLNEKRSEISKIEMKQRIHVLLVPNKTLETPNYKLERLKHDDPRLDNIEASYKMAEEHEDPTTVTRRSQERHNKQEPLIKGVLPDAPAPMAPPKAMPELPAPRPAPVAAAPVPLPAPAPAPTPVEKGLFGWLKSLFAGPPAPAPVPAPAPAPASAVSVVKEVRKIERPGEAAREARPDGRPERGERSERGGRDGRRGGRNRADGAPEGRAEGRPEGRNGEQRRERNPEGRAELGRPEQRPERQERPAGEPRAAGRQEGRSDQAAEGQPRLDSEGRGERSRRGERTERPERAERQERADRMPRDAAEQDLALANQAAMAAAMNGEAAPQRQERAERPERAERQERAERPERQERPAQDAGREGERRPTARAEGRSEETGEVRRERGERGGERNGRRNERRHERADDSAAPVAGVQADSFDAAHPALVTGLEPSAENAALVAPAADLPLRAPGAEEGQDRPQRERRSRDRYGRDRRERGERGERTEQAGEAPAFQPHAEFSASQPAQTPQEPAPLTAELAAPVPASLSAPVPAPALAAEAAAPAPAAPMPAAAPVAKPVPAPVPEARPTTTGALPKVQAYALPLEDLAQVAQSSGLQWVNSDAAKIAEAQAAIAAEVKPIQVPRERPPVVVLEEAPLVLVETRRHLDSMPLPFEKSGD